MIVHSEFPGRSVTLCRRISYNSVNFCNLLSSNGPTNHADTPERVDLSGKIYLSWNTQSPFSSPSQFNWTRAATNMSFHSLSFGECNAVLHPLYFSHYPGAKIKILGQAAGTWTCRKKGHGYSILDIYTLISSTVRRLFLSPHTRNSVVPLVSKLAAVQHGPFIFSFFLSSSFFFLFLFRARTACPRVFKREWEK